ncbi:MAG: DUF5652 family protein [Patescibacteria group bacterium]
METLLAGFSISNELLILSLLTLPVKAVALWKAARIDQKWWFAALFITNTFGILDFIYIFFIAKKYKVESKEI